MDTDEMKDVVSLISPIWNEGRVPRKSLEDGLQHMEGRILQFLMLQDNHSYAANILWEEKGQQIIIIIILTLFLLVTVMSRWSICPFVIVL